MDAEKTAETFEPREWLDRVGPFLPNEYGRWFTRDVIGPRDACWILRIRETLRDYVSFGPPVPVDLFLLGLGEAPTRDRTKIGGLPFWPYGREWPRSATGQPLPFLAQFCFRESTDIVDAVPEDMLLLFGDKDNPSTIVAEWQASVCQTRLVDRGEMPVAPLTPCFYGTRWRTETYPEATYDDDPLVLADGSRVSDMWFVHQLMGMQISRYPFFLRWDGRPAKAERAVCSMSSIFPVPDLPCPFTNRSLPLARQEAEQLCLYLCHLRGANAFGVVCVVVADSGEPIVMFDNLG